MMFYYSLNVQIFEQYCFADTILFIIFTLWMHFFVINICEYLKKIYLCTPLKIGIGYKNIKYKAMKRVLVILGVLIMGTISLNAQSTMESTKKNFSNKAVITPLPVLIIATYDENGNPDAMNAAWGGQCGPKHITFELSKHQTTENIRNNKAFTVSFADKKHVVQSDYFGIVSAKKEPDKIKKAGMTVSRSQFVNAPVINEYPLTVEWKVAVFEEDGKGGARVVGEIVNMQADENILDENGNIDLGKLEPIMFDSSKNYYRVIGEKVGNAFSDGAKIK